MLVNDGSLSMNQHSGMILNRQVNGVTELGS